MNPLPICTVILASAGLSLAPVSATVTVIGYDESAILGLLRIEDQGSTPTDVGLDIRFFYDPGSDGVDIAEFLMPSAANQWQFNRKTTTSVEKVAALLDDNAFVLYDPTSQTSPRIVLSPGNGQILIDSVPVLTRGSGTGAGVVFPGTYSSGETGANVPATGSGTRTMWYPERGAFRAGQVTGTQWDAANIGAHSVAFGYNTRASGTGSFAAGSGSIASGAYSMAHGYNQFVQSGYSAAFGAGHVIAATAANSFAAGEMHYIEGWGSTAFGQAHNIEQTALISFAAGEGNWLWGTASMALGVWSTAGGGTSSTAIGFLNVAEGEAAMAFGVGTQAVRAASTALGRWTLASGEASLAANHYTTAASYASSAFGRFNVGGGTPTSWVGEDPLFEIGIGTSPSNRANAVTVRKDGEVTIVKLKPQGDILMGEFGPN